LAGVGRGEKPMQRVEGGLDRREKDKLFKKGNAEQGTVQEEIAGEKFGERIEGLGFAPIKIENMREMLETQTHERQEGFANDLTKAHGTGDGDMEEVGGGEDDGDGVDYAALLAGIEGGGDYGGGTLDKLGKKAKKEMKKAVKVEKKRLKAEKKDSKKEKKEKKSRVGTGEAKRPSSDSSDSEVQSKNPRQLDQEQRHREWAGGGSSSVGGKVRSRSREREPRRDRSRERDRVRDNEREPRHREWAGGGSSSGGGKARSRSREREPRRDGIRDRDRDRSRDRDRTRGR